MNTCVCAVSFYHTETPLALIKIQLITITRDTFRHCRVHLYTCRTTFHKTAVKAGLTHHQRRGTNAVDCAIFHVTLHEGSIEPHVPNKNSKMEVLPAELHPHVDAIDIEEGLP